MKKYLIILFIFITSQSSLFAQDDRTDRIGIGVGPATMYGDNTGITRDFKFKVLPAVTVDYHKKLHTFFDVRGAIGWQMVNSGDFYKEHHIVKIAEHNLPHAFEGNAFYAEAMPVGHLNPNQSGYLPATYKVYAGVGLGVAHVTRTDHFVIDPANINLTRSAKGTNTSVYVPLRAGVSKDLQKQGWEIALEPSMMVSFFGELDGNDLQQKTIKPDILFQLQFFVRRKLDKY